MSQYFGTRICGPGNACFHDVSVSQNFGTRNCGPGNACFHEVSVSQNFGTRNCGPGSTCFREVSVSQNFGTRIFGAPTRWRLRFSVSLNIGTRNLSHVPKTETRNLSLAQTRDTSISVPLWQPRWTSHLHVPSGHNSQRQSCTHTAAHVITSSHACSIARAVGPVKYHVAVGEKRIRGRQDVHWGLDFGDDLI